MPVFSPLRSPLEQAEKTTIISNNEISLCISEGFDLLFSIKPQRGLHNTKFKVNISHQLPQVQIDVGQIQQVSIFHF